MTMTTEALQPGDPVFHPKHGFGTVRGLSRRQGVSAARPAVGPEQPSQDQEYYDIELLGGGMLMVPVDRAAGLGVRRLMNGVDDVTGCLNLPARALPDNPRERLLALKVRERGIEPNALAATVRDMLVQSRGRHLSASEKAWLDNSCDRLSTEAALVDRIAKAEARAAILAAVSLLARG
jgi:RNA polymerase-interacting CarD/CdnL/TRCF family regulator